MKRLWAAVAILLLLLGSSLWGGRQVAAFSQTCVQQLKGAQQLAQQDDWAQARTITQRVYKHWEEHNFPLHALMRHSDTDQIKLSFRAVEQHLLQEDMDQYAAANAVLIGRLEMLAEMELPKAENVL